MKKKPIKQKLASPLMPQVINGKGLRVLDGWANVFNQLGVMNSSTAGGNVFMRDPVLQEQKLTDLYASDGIARRLVNLLPENALRNFIKADELLLNELKRLKAKQKIMDACIWSRLYGGAVLVAFVDDGRAMDKPLEIKNVKKLVHLRVYDRYRVTYQTEDLSTNYYSEHYGQPEVFTISPVDGESFKVHRSRLHIFEGATVPDSVKSQNNYWNQSILQSVYNDLINLQIAKNSATSILSDFVQNAIGVSNLTGMVGSDDENQMHGGNGNMDLASRMQLLNITKSVANGVYYDSDNESYQKISANVAGFAELFDRTSYQVCAAETTPHSLIFGTSPSGLNATGEADIENFNNRVSTYRVDEIEPCITWLIPILEAQKVWEGERPKNFEWEFPPLKVSNESEVAQNMLLAAQADAIYIDRGGVDANFMFSMRYADGNWQQDVFIPPAKLKEQEREMDQLKIDPANMDLAVSVKEEVIKDSEHENTTGRVRSRIWNYMKGKLKK